MNDQTPSEGASDARPSPIAVCRRCPSTYAAHVDSDHAFEQLTVDHDLPAWLTDAQRRMFDRAAAEEQRRRSREHAEEEPRAEATRRADEAAAKAQAYLEQRDDARALVDQLRHEVTTCQANLDTARARLERRRATIADLRAEVTEYDRTLETVRRERDEARKAAAEGTYTDAQVRDIENRYEETIARLDQHLKAARDQRDKAEKLAEARAQELNRLEQQPRGYIDGADADPEPEPEPDIEPCTSWVETVMHGARYRATCDLLPAGHPGPHICVADDVFPGAFTWGAVDDDEPTVAGCEETVKPCPSQVTIGGRVWDCTDTWGHAGDHTAETLRFGSVTW